MLQCSIAHLADADLTSPLGERGAVLASSWLTIQRVNAARPRTVHQNVRHVVRQAARRRIVQGAHASMRLADDGLVLPVPPRSLEVYQWVTRALARVYRFDRDEYRVARDELARALQREPGFALAWAVRGYLDAVDASARISADLSDERGAELVARTERAIALDPRLALSHQARSLALVNAGRRADALQAAEKAVSLSPLDPQGSVVLASALVANGRMAEALHAIDVAQSRYAVPPALFDFVRAKVLWGNDRFDEAVAAASRCLEKVPHFVACRAIRAVASDGMGRLEAAREDLKEYRVSVPGTPAHALGPGSYGVPKLQNDWLADIRGEIGLP
jgi:tetratricopeptide (TPR) repeat protein